MTAITAAPLVMTAVKFAIQDPITPTAYKEYECHVSAVTIESDQEVLTHETLCPEGSFSALGKESFSVVVTAVQDWTADGLTRFLWENAGKAAKLRFTPGGNTPPTVEAPMFICDVVLPRPDVGGEINTYATTEITFAVTGVPLIQTTTPTVLEADEEQLELEPAAA
jgi:hypothetical protein